MSHNFVQSTFLRQLGLLLTLSVLLVAQPAHADWTESMKLVQGFGCCHEGFSYSLNYKIMLQAKSGNRYFVWYHKKLDAPIGATLIVTLSACCGKTYWERLTNPQNGKESTIKKVLKVNK